MPSNLRTQVIVNIIYLSGFKDPHLLVSQFNIVETTDSIDGKILQTYLNLKILYLKTI